MKRRPAQLRPHRLLWVKHHYEPGDGPRDPVFYAPTVDVKRSVAIEQRPEGWRCCYDETAWGVAYDQLEDAIAEAERQIFKGIRTTVDALGGWGAVCAATQEEGS